MTSSFSLKRVRSCRRSFLYNRFLFDLSDRSSRLGSSEGTRFDCSRLPNGLQSIILDWLRRGKRIRLNSSRLPYRLERCCWFRLCHFRCLKRGRIRFWLHFRPWRHRLRFDKVSWFQLLRVLFEGVCSFLGSCFLHLFLDDLRRCLFYNWDGFFFFFLLKGICFQGCSCFFFGLQGWFILFFLFKGIILH